MAIMQGPPVQEEVPQEAGGVFPVDQEQAEKFLLNTIKVIHEDETVPEALNQALGKGAPAATVLGAMAAQILVLLFTQVYKQTNGMQVHPEFAVEVVRRAVTELAEIAKAEGVSVSKEDLQGAAKIAGDSLEQSMDQLYDGPQATQGPQGVMQGPPQGQPQQGGM